ncbi:hypothetical protein [Caballeronia mineralivorans]|nr:hypothetical protein [Caballeronia mineralivorans]MDB5788228.1 hypothetical protein [Caballeronia mineralivorans]
MHVLILVLLIAFVAVGGLRLLGMLLRLLWMVIVVVLCFYVFR